ncbi:MAG: hypothetical protein AAGA65_09120 [Actinomycetota bacterium]
MTVNPAAGPVAAIRDLLAQGIAETLSGTEELVDVGSLAAPPDWPGAILRRSGPLDLIGDAGASYCVFELPFELLLMTGPWPGSDGAAGLLDAWVARLGAPNALEICAEYEDWPDSMHHPIVEAIDEEQIFEIGGPNVYGCTVRILAQIELKPIQGE